MNKDPKLPHLMSGQVWLARIHGELKEVKIVKVMGMCLQVVHRQNLMGEWGVATRWYEVHVDIRMVEQFD